MYIFFFNFINRFQISILANVCTLFYDLTVLIFAKTFNQQNRIVLTLKKTKTLKVSNKLIPIDLNFFFVNLNVRTENRNRLLTVFFSYLCDLENRHNQTFCHPVTYK